MNTHSRCCSPAGTGCPWPPTHTPCAPPRTCPCLSQPSLVHGAKAGVPELTIVRVIRSISCLSLVLCCRKGLCLWPRGEKGTQWCPPMPASSLPVPAHSPPEQLEEHAAQREPVGAAVVRHPFLQHLWSHVPMGAPVGAQSRVRDRARQAGRAGRGAGTLTHWHGASFWRSRRPGPGLRCGRAQTHPGGCLPAAETSCHP